MNITIQVLSANHSTGKSAKGTVYQIVELAYKDMEQGKVASKKIFSFNKHIFNEAVKAQAGNTYEVAMQKGEQYWEWVTMKWVGGVDQASSPTGFTPQTTQGTFNGGSSKPTPVKTTYETPEERAARQVLIVRQSSLSTATNLLLAGAKSPPSTEAVLGLAQQLTDWVFGNDKVKDNPSLIDMPDDLPE